MIIIFRLAAAPVDAMWTFASSHLIKTPVLPPCDTATIDALATQRLFFTLAIYNKRTKPLARLKLKFWGLFMNLPPD